MCGLGRVGRVNSSSRTFLGCCFGSGAAGPYIFTGPQGCSSTGVAPGLEKCKGDMPMTNVRKNSAKLTREDLKIAPESYPDLPHLPGQTGGEQVLADSEKDQNQEVQPCPVYDETAERGTSGMARQDEAGRTERPGEVQQLRSAVPLTRRLTHCPGRSDQVVSAVASRAPGV